MTEHTESALSITDTPITARLIQAIATTEFVPAAYRGRPAAITACMLTGREIGLSPMESLRLIDVIDGKPSPSGELMVTMIRRAGHRVRVVEQTDRACTLEGVRAENGDDTMEVTYDLAMAERAGLTRKKNWERYPEAMLFWRAVSMLARQQFPDAINGLSHLPEELGSAEWVESPDPDDLDGEVLELEVGSRDLVGSSPTTSGVSGFRRDGDTSWIPAVKRLLVDRFGTEEAAARWELAETFDVAGSLESAADVEVVEKVVDVLVAADFLDTHEPEGETK